MRTLRRRRSEPVLQAVLVLVFLAMSGAGCSLLSAIGIGGQGGDQGGNQGGGTGGDQGGGSVDGYGTVTGTVFGPDGDTPIANAFVYVPEPAVTQQAANGPPEPAATWTLSAVTGRFSLTDVPAGNTTLKVAKGSFSRAFGMAVAADETTEADPADTTLPASGLGAGRMAVVTGAFDRMQDVLAKLGFGRVAPQTGRLVPGSQSFDLVDGGTDDPALPAHAPTFDDLLSEGLSGYSTIFLNCGCDELPLINAHDATVPAIRSYVEGGGNLYVTDLAYDYVEQCFPDAVDFHGSPLTPEGEAEEYGAAQAGTGGLVVSADAVNDTLSDWLGGRGAMSSGGTVRIAGLLAGWAVIESVAPTTAVWTRGPVEWAGGAGDRPLAVSFSYGGGKVFYSSYHTEEETLSADLRPQEWVLSYLAFEAM